MLHSLLTWQAGKQNKVVTVLICESDNVQKKFVKQKTRTLQRLGPLVVFLLKSRVV